MTLVLSGPQREVLIDLGRDGAEPLVWARIDTGVVVALRILSAPPLDAPPRWAVVTGQVSEVYATFVAAPAATNPLSGEVGLSGGETPEEIAALVADVWARLDGETGVVQAWSYGDTAYVRLDGPLDESASLDTGIPTGGVSLVAEGEAEWLYSTRSPLTFVSGGEEMEWTPASILDVTGAAQELERETRRVTHARRELVLRWDRLVEQMIERCPLQGRTVTIRRGTRQYPIQSWVPAGVYVVTDGPYVDELGSDPRPYRDDERPSIRLVLEDRVQYALEASALSEEADQIGIFTCRHPLEVAREVLTRALTGRAGATGIPLVDAASFDPSAEIWSDPPDGMEPVSHWTWARNPTAFWAGAVIQGYTFQRSRPNSGNPSDWVASGAIPTEEQPRGRYAPAREQYLIRTQSEQIEPASHQEILDQVLLLVPGQVLAEEDGVIRARRIDRRQIEVGTAQIRDWTYAFEPESLSDMRRSMISRVILGLGAGMADTEWSGYYRSNYALEDTSSARAHTIRGLPRLIRDLTLDSEVWATGALARGLPELTPTILGGVTELPATAAAPLSLVRLPVQYSPLRATSTALRVLGLQFGGFAGARSDAVATPGDVALPPAWARVTSARRAYLRLSSPADRWRVDDIYWLEDRNEGFEVIECDGATLPPVGFEGAGSGGFTGDPDAPITLGALDYQIATRAVEGSAPTYWLTGCPIADITMARVLTRDYLDPWSWGAPTIEGRTPLSELDVQIGDWVTIPLPHHIDYRQVGGLGLVWQVIAKAEQSSHVEWRLQLAYRPGQRIVPRPVPPPRVGDPRPPVPPVAPPPVIRVTGRGSLSLAEEGAPTIPDAPPPGGGRRTLVVVVAMEGGTTTAVEYGGRALDFVSESTSPAPSVQIWCLRESEIAAASGSAIARAGSVAGCTVWVGWYQAAEYAGLTGTGGTGDRIDVQDPTPRSPGPVILAAYMGTGSGPSAEGSPAAPAFVLVPGAAVGTGHRLVIAEVDHQAAGGRLVADYPVSQDLYAAGVVLLP